MGGEAQKKSLGLVLSAGGARAAYQVGVLRYLAHELKDFSPKIFTGISAGSINASFLAQGKPPDAATDALYHLWANIDFNQVFKTNFRSVFFVMGRLLYDLFLSKVTRRLLLKSFLDATPLAQTLVSNIDFTQIARGIHNKLVDGVAISATNYQLSSTTIFFDSARDIKPWHRENRTAVRSHIKPRHILASCSIPLVFEPVRIGRHFYGDGSLRFSFPLSPAIHLGATHLLGLSIHPEIAPASPGDWGSESLAPPSSGASPSMDWISMGFVAGCVLNSIFMESLEADFENLQRMNEATSGLGMTRKIPALLLRPSQDLGVIAQAYLNEVPFHFRQLLKGFSLKATDMGDLLSYLMFSPGYVRALLALGEKDAERRRGEVAQFLASAED